MQGVWQYYGSYVGYVSFTGLDEMTHEIVRMRRLDPATEGDGGKPR